MHFQSLVKARAVQRWQYLERSRDLIYGAVLTQHFQEVKTKF